MQNGSKTKKKLIQHIHRHGSMPYGQIREKKRRKQRTPSGYVLPRANKFRTKNQTGNLENKPKENPFRADHYIGEIKDWSPKVTTEKYKHRKKKNTMPGSVLWATRTTQKIIPNLNFISTTITNVFNHRAIVLSLYANYRGEKKQLKIKISLFYQLNPVLSSAGPIYQCQS